MENLFLLVVSLVMFPMIFAVPLLYSDSLLTQNKESGFVSMTTAIIVTVAIWVFVGYYLSFNQFDTLNFHEHFVNWLIKWAAKPSLSEILNMLVQLDFALYAVVMFSGTALAKHTWPFFMIFIPLWLLLVYAPLANLIWSTSGYLHSVNVLDFSGGLVVHLSAGVTSLVIAFTVKPVRKSITKSHNTNYLATVLIITGWFGFNLAPVGSINHLTGLVVLNTLLAIIFGSVGWCLNSYRVEHILNMENIQNGILSGLVTSTALVGYVPPYGMIATTFISGIISHTVTVYSHKSPYFFDLVDSFSINAIGGFLGTIGLIIFANPQINNLGAKGLLTGNVDFALIEIFGILSTIVITIVGTIIAHVITMYLIGNIHYKESVQ